MVLNMFCVPHVFKKCLADCQMFWAGESNYKPRTTSMVDYLRGWYPLGVPKMGKIHHFQLFSEGFPVKHEAIFQPAMFVYHRCSSLGGVPPHQSSSLRRSSGSGSAWRDAFVASVPRQWRARKFTEKWPTFSIGSFHLRDSDLEISSLIQSQ